jgi:murein DD-endopeptidase MepM/ murein hydrolase activator NlpD
MEHSRLRAVVATYSVALVLTTSINAPSSQAFDYGKTTSESVVDASRVEVVSTHSGQAYPVVSSLGVSQQYHSFHRGLDIRAPKGSAVVSIAAGVVIEVTEQIYGYGKHVRIAHDGTMSSMYAHLDAISVGVGQKVQKGEVIGAVGTTGWATGPHLHLEVYEGQRVINPLTILTDLSD